MSGWTRIDFARRRRFALFLEVLDWLTKYADHEPDWADACLAVLSARDKDLEGMDLRPKAPDNLAPAGRNSHSLSGQIPSNASLI
jgi:hypothetical protein